MLFAFSGLAAAQHECVIRDAPALFNLELGMSGREAEQAVGRRLKIAKVKENGVIFQSYVKKTPPAIFSGLRVIYLRFFDSKLYQMEFFYENTGIGLEDFVSKISADKDLPFDAWKINYGIANLQCNGFSVRADNFINPRIELTDDAAREGFMQWQKDKKSSR